MNMTVEQLIEVLRQLPQDLEVDMAMTLDMEYQCRVDADMVVVKEHGGRRYVCITNSER